MSAACGSEHRSAQPAAPRRVATAGVEVLAGDGRMPSHDLAAQLQRGEDDLVLFDVGYFVFDAVVATQRVWLDLENDRADGLREALRQLVPRHADAASPSDARCSVARVAAALLDPQRTGPFSPNSEEAQELEEVSAFGPGTMRFLQAPRAIDWRRCRPRGVYGEADGDLSRLFAADHYLQAYLDAWPAESAHAWRRAIAHLDAETQAALARSDRAIDRMLGRPLARGMTGVAGVHDWPDAAWLARQPVREPWQQLQRMFASLGSRAPASVRDAFLAAARTLATERPDDGLLAAMPTTAWHHKWQDTAQWLWLGLREVDAIGIMLCEATTGRRPTVLIEPLPQSLAALREVYEQLLSVLQEGGGGNRGGIEDSLRLLDDVQRALRDQGAGRAPDDALQRRLLAALLTHFRHPDVARDATTVLPCVDGALRRASPRLLRIPVHWRGATRHALALRLVVERQRGDGSWQGPPWGVALRFETKGQ